MAGKWTVEYEPPDVVRPGKRNRPGKAVATYTEPDPAEPGGQFECVVADKVNPDDAAEVQAFVTRCRKALEKYRAERAAERAEEEANRAVGRKLADALNAEPPALAPAPPAA
jgi:hypothetical protein